MPRRQRDWVPMQGYGAGVSVPPQGTQDWILVVPRDVSLPNLAAATPTEVATVEEGTEVATTRTVGQVLIVAPGEVVVVIERIRVGLIDNAGATAFFANSFLDPEDANEPFLWQRVSVCGGAATENMGAFAHPWWSAIDCRVGRRLGPDQALFYSCFNNAAAGTDSITVRPFLRTLARNA